MEFRPVSRTVVSNGNAASVDGYHYSPTLPDAWGIPQCRPSGAIAANTESCRLLCLPARSQGNIERTRAPSLATQLRRPGSNNSIHHAPTLPAVLGELCSLEGKAHTT